MHLHSNQIKKRKDFKGFKTKIQFSLKKDIEFVRLIIQERIFNVFIIFKMIESNRWMIQFESKLSLGERRHSTIAAYKQVYRVNSENNCHSKLVQSHSARSAISVHLYKCHVILYSNERENKQGVNVCQVTYIIRCY